MCKSPFYSKKCVCLIVTSVGCFSPTVQNDECLYSLNYIKLQPKISSLLLCGFGHSGQDAETRAARQSTEEGLPARSRACTPPVCQPILTLVYSLTQCLKQHHRSPEQSYSILCGEIHQPWLKQQPVSIFGVIMFKLMHGWMDKYIDGFVTDASFL